MFSLFQKKCAFCKKKVAEPRKYFNDRQKPIHVCYNCITYAERRAFRTR